MEAIILTFKDYYFHHATFDTWIIIQLYKKLTKAKILKY